MAYSQYEVAAEVGLHRPRKITAITQPCVANLWCWLLGRPVTSRTISRSSVLRWPFANRFSSESARVRVENRRLTGPWVAESGPLMTSVRAFGGMSGRGRALQRVHGRLWTELRPGSRTGCSANRSLDHGGHSFRPGAEPGRPASRPRDRSTSGWGRGLGVGMALGSTIGQLSVDIRTAIPWRDGK